jgi:broad specificity phosphatase PhoE
MSAIVIPSPVIIVRHGETAGNVQPEHIRGWSNLPLNAEGVKEADEIGEQLKPFSIVEIYSSDLQRAVETAEHIRAASGTSAEVTPLRQLRPWNVGIYTGMPTNDVIEPLTFYIKHPDAPVPQGESFDHFVRRFAGIFMELLGEAKFHHDGARVIVTHSRNVRVALAYLTEGESALTNPSADRFITIGADPVEPGHAMLLMWNGQQWNIHTLPGGNDAS